MLKSRYTQTVKEMEWHPLEQGVFGDARKIKIAVVGIGRESGASFVAANLAYHLAKHVDGVTYMEAEDAQIAETLEGRRHACYSLALADVLGLACSAVADCSSPSDRPPSSVSPPVRSSERNRYSGHDRRTEHASIPAFCARGTRGKFTDYFALEREGLPAGSCRNLYANVNWAVRAPLGSAVSGAWRRARSHATLEAASPGIPPSSGGQADRFGACAPLEAAPSETGRGARPRKSRALVSEPCILAETRGVGRIPGRYMIVDNPRPESLWEADFVIGVVDPLPSRFRSGVQQLEALRDNQIRFGKRFSPLLNLPSPVLWVLNKDNPQVSRRELERSLNVKFDFAVPLLPSEVFYKAECSSVPIFQMLEDAGGVRPLAPRGADGCGVRPRFHCDTGAGKPGGRGFWQTGRAPAGASAGGSSGQPRSGCAAACGEFGRLAKSLLKLLD